MTEKDNKCLRGENYPTEWQHKPMPPLKAIRKKCLDCNGTINEVKLCPCVHCALWPFRFGKNPFSKGRKLSDEQKKKLAENLRKAREQKLNDNNE